jgi:hypothetical protein
MKIIDEIKLPYIFYWQKALIPFLEGKSFIDRHKKKWFLGEFSGGQKKSPESVKKVTFRLWNQISYMSYC